MSARVVARNEPTSILIAALGGQGGGVLTGWIVHAARAEGLTAQATSTPGVSQRTGATSYYVELAAKPPPGETAPVLALAPVPGRVDVLACSELLECARMLERGLCAPSRTVVVASTHRVYTTREKMSRDDGRYDAERILDAVRSLSRHAVLLDMEALRARHRASISAVLFGALAGSGALPLSRTACEGAIRAAGVGVERSLAAFDEAYRCASDVAQTTATLPRRAFAPTPVAALAQRAAALPASMAAFAHAGIAQLVAYQDDRYATLYVERVERIARAARGRGAIAETAAREAARYLALWMAYDDLCKVASAKSRASRFARIREEAAAGPGDVVRVRDYFRPGLAEIAAILPVRGGLWLERRAATRSPGRPAGRSLTLQTSSVAGAVAMRLVAALRAWRRHSLRYRREQSAIDEWLALVEGAMGGVGGGAADAALELARLPRLLKGYGDTHAAGRDRFERTVGAYRMAGAGSAAAAVLQATADASREHATCAPAALSDTMKVRPRPVTWLRQR